MQKTEERLREVVDTDIRELGIIEDNCYNVSLQLGLDEILCSLAEESTELAQAALKLRRSLTQKNPTPKTEKECAGNLLEELVDVSVCLEVLGYYKVFLEISGNNGDFDKLQEQKSYRWVQRIKDKLEAN